MSNFDKKIRSVGSVISLFSAASDVYDIPANADSADRDVYKSARYHPPRSLEQVRNEGVLPDQRPSQWCYVFE